MQGQEVVIKRIYWQKLKTEDSCDVSDISSCSNIIYNRDMGWEEKFFKPFYIKCGESV